MSRFLLTARLTDGSMTYFWFDTEEELNNAVRHEEYNIDEVFEAIEILSHRDIIKLS